jgi:hypothetical protein
VLKLANDPSTSKSSSSETALTKQKSSTKLPRHVLQAQSLAAQFQSCFASVIGFSSAAVVQVNRYSVEIVLGFVAAVR